MLAGSLWILVGNHTGLLAFNGLAMPVSLRAITAAQLLFIAMLARQTPLLCETEVGSTFWQWLRCTVLCCYTPRMTELRH